MLCLTQKANIASVSQKDKLIDKSRNRSLSSLTSKKASWAARRPLTPPDFIIKNAAAIAEAFRKDNLPVFLVRVAFSADGKKALRPVVDTPWPARRPRRTGRVELSPKWR